jgi:hypothetical protein
MFTGPGQLSDAVGLTSGGSGSVHKMVTSGGTKVNIGGVVSSTWMSCTVTVLLPHWSVALQVRRI